MTKQQLEQELAKAHEQIDQLQGFLDDANDSLFRKDHEHAIKNELEHMKGKVAAYERLFTMLDRYLQRGAE